MKYYIIALIAFALIVLIIAILFKIYEKKQKPKEQFQSEPIATTPKSAPIKQTEYEIKQKYLSNVELEFYTAIQSILEDKFILFPQVPLSQIIVKKSEKRYQSELYRVIDFCIFTKSYTPLVCVEINDSTHHQKERYIRDKKVKEILNKDKRTH